MWEVVVYRGVIDGKKDYVRDYAHSEREANILCARMVEKVLSGRPIKSSKLALGEYLQRWLSHYKVVTRSEETYLQAEWACNRAIAALGSIPLNKLSPMDIQGYLDRQEGLKPKSIKHLRDWLRNALNQAVEWELLDKSPMNGVHLPPMRRQIPKVWTKEQLKQFFREAERHRLYAAFYLAAKTGMREGEIVRLKWGHVDLGKGNISVQGQTKTDPSLRTVPISKKTIGVLQKHLKRQSKEKAVLGDVYHDEGYVFTSPKKFGQPLKPDSLYGTFKRIAKKAGLPHLPFHGLRHSFATMLLQSGVHPKIVANLLGHSEVRTTLDTYSHVLPSMGRESIVPLDKVF